MRIFVCLAVSFLACASPADLVDDGSLPDAGNVADAGRLAADAGRLPEDAGVAEAVDAGRLPDAGRPTFTVDAGVPAAVDAGAAGPWTRDWQADPPVALATAPGTLYGLSDVHGGYDRAVALLTNAGLAQVSGDGTASWTGGNAVLVVTGDLIDKGDRSVDTLDLFRALEADAPRTGGRVLVTLGNHEAEFLGDPQNHKADALRLEIDALGLTPEQFASSDSRWGRFLQRRPIAALVSGWFFSHAGHSGGRSVSALEQQFRAAVDAGNWDADVLVAVDSPLEARNWWSSGVLDADLGALGAKHIVMGHDPNAFNEKGLVGAHFQGRLLRIDTGMSPAVDNSQGRLLKVVGAGSAHEVASSLSHSGASTGVSLTAP